MAHGRGIVMVFLAILVSAVFWFCRADRQTDRITEADDRYTHATIPRRRE